MEGHLGLPCLCRPLRYHMCGTLQEVVQSRKLVVRSSTFGRVPEV